VSFLRDLVRRLQAEQDAELGLVPATDVLGSNGKGHYVGADRPGGTATVGDGPCSASSEPEKPTRAATDCADAGGTHPQDALTPSPTASPVSVMSAVAADRKEP
jgi:hypothetical protein